MKFIKIFICFFLLFLTNQDSNYYLNSLGNSDLSKCMASETSTCKSVSLSSKTLECCKISTYYYKSSYSSGLDFDMCMPYVKTKITESQIKSIQQVYREAMGFTLANYPYSDYSNYLDYIPSFKQSYDCKSQSFEIDYKVGTYTDEEIKIFKDDNYCLRLYYQGLMDLNLLQDGFLNINKKSITKSDCNNAILLPSTQNIATCAFGSFIFRLSNGKTQTLNTCLYISKNAFDTKTLDQHLESSFEQYTSINGTSIESFQIDITDKNNNKLKYDSTTKSLTKSSFMQISKIILIILFICLF